MYKGNEMEEYCHICNSLIDVTGHGKEEAFSCPTCDTGYFYKNHMLVEMECDLFCGKRKIGINWVHDNRKDVMK
jgi:DNA-directed RNA polymerase subunit M/transcription elongation factor TFIIS